jgi:hypothetical protein
MRLSALGCAAGARCRRSASRCHDVSPCFPLILPLLILFATIARLVFPSFLVSPASCFSFSLSLRIHHPPFSGFKFSLLSVGAVPRAGFSMLYTGIHCVHFHTFITTRHDATTSYLARRTLVDSIARFRRRCGCRHGPSSSAAADTRSRSCSSASVCSARTWAA